MWLTFSIIIDLLPSQGIVIGGNIVVIHWINQALKWVYLVFLALQFVLALGNRPKGERMAYTVTLWYVTVFLQTLSILTLRRVYAILSVYLLVCSFWLTSLSFKAIPEALAKNKGFVETFLSPPLGPLMAAMIATFGKRPNILLPYDVVVYPRYRHLLLRIMSLREFSLRSAFGI